MAGTAEHAVFFNGMRTQIFPSDYMRVVGWLRFAADRDVTPGGNTGAPGSAGRGWASDLSKSANRVTFALLVKL